MKTRPPLITSLDDTQGQRENGVWLGRQQLAGSEVIRNKCGNNTSNSASLRHTWKNVILSHDKADHRERYLLSISIEGSTDKATKCHFENHEQ